jgi:alkylation response protein AidB-like acyl-CoA dehydrogenase
MNFDLDDGQRMLADGAARYVREQATLEAHRAAIRTPEGFSRSRWAALAEMGWLALPLPEAAGGLGGTLVEVTLIAEAMGRGLMTEPFVDTVVLCGHLLAGSSAWLKRIAEGDAVLALAHLEAGARCEHDSVVATRAHAQASGYRLNGLKTLVFHGAAADAWLVSARLGESLALFMVERGTPGVELRGYELIDGTRAADLQLQDVELPAAALVLPPDHAAATLAEAFDRASLALSAAALGSMEAVLGLTVDYVRTRVQFGQPISKFQAVQHRLAEMLVETEQARSILYAALAGFEADDAGVGRRAVSAAKSLIARAGHFVAANGIQLHGGVGVTEEFAVGHHYKALLVYDKRFGDAAFHLQRYGNHPCTTTCP